MAGRRRDTRSPEAARVATAPLAGRVVEEMSTLGRSVRSVFGKKARTIVVVVIVGFSLGVFLAMSIVNANITSNTRQLSEQMERTVTVRPAGGFGFFSSEAMSESVVTTARSVDDVEAVNPVIMQFMQDDNGTSGGGGPFGRPRGSLVEGSDPSQGLFIMNGGTVTISEGRTLSANDSSSYVAVVGTQYADDKGVGVGDWITVGDSSFEIVGIYSSGTRFGDMTVIVPYNTAKTALGVSGPTTVYVTADSVGHVDSVRQALIDALGSDYDVTSANERGTEMQDTINAIKGNSQMGAYLALVTGMAIMAFVMVLITRERFREIGILKAIGFKNSRIVTQLVTETMMLATMGFVIGVVIAAAVGPYLSTMVVSSSVTVPSGPTGGPGGGFRPGGGAGDAGRASAGLFGADFALDPGLTALTLVMALVLGVVGSLYPVLKAIKLKPAEALRYE